MVFEAELLLPNGKKDAYPADNKIIGAFEAVPKQDSVLIIYLLTNNQPGQNSYAIVNEKGGNHKRTGFRFIKSKHGLPRYLASPERPISVYASGYGRQRTGVLGQP